MKRGQLLREDALQSRSRGSWCNEVAVQKRQAVIIIADGERGTHARRLLINEAEIATVAAEADAVEEVLAELDAELRIHVLRHRDVEGAATPTDSQDAWLRRSMKLHVNDVFERVPVD